MNEIPKSSHNEIVFEELIKKELNILDFHWKHVKETYCWRSGFRYVAREQ